VKSFLAGAELVHATIETKNGDISVICRISLVPPLNPWSRLQVDLGASGHGTLSHVPNNKAVTPAVEVAVE